MVRDATRRESCVRCPGCATPSTLKQSKMHFFKNAFGGGKGTAAPLKSRARTKAKQDVDLLFEKSKRTLLAEASFWAPRALRQPARAPPPTWRLRGSACSSPFVVLLSELHPSPLGGCATVGARLALNGGRRVCAVFSLSPSPSDPACPRRRPPPTHTPTLPTHRRRREGT